MAAGSLCIFSISAVKTLLPGLPTAPRHLRMEMSLHHLLMEEGGMEEEIWYESLQSQWWWWRWRWR